MGLLLPKKGRVKDTSLINRIAKAEGKAKWDKALFDATSKLLITGFNAGLGKGKIGLANGRFAGETDPFMLTAFETNLYRFSAGKSLIELQELNRLFRKAKSVKEFKIAAKQITDVFNDRWLESEYNTALLSAQATTTYYRLLSKIDLYPYWQYKTIGDDRVREAHAALDGLILPWNSPFWNKIFPPNDWNCRCYIIGVTAKDAEGIDMKAMVEKANFYLDSDEYKRAEKGGWGVNRAETGEAFTQSQSYIRDAFDMGNKKLNNLTPADYGLSPLVKGGQGDLGDLPIYDGTDREYIDALEALNDYRIMRDYNNRAHALLKLPANSLKLAKAANEAMMKPNEVWLNSPTEEGIQSQFVFVKYYNDTAMIVIGNEVNKIRQIKKWFTVTTSEAEQYRKGLLIK